jgi:hypothetical protein
LAEERLAKMKAEQEEEINQIDIETLEEQDKVAEEAQKISM